MMENSWVCMWEMGTEHARSLFSVMGPFTYSFTHCTVDMLMLYMSWSCHLRPTSHYQAFKCVCVCVPFFILYWVLFFHAKVQPSGNFHLLIVMCKLTLTVVLTYCPFKIIIKKKTYKKVEKCWMNGAIMYQ